MGIKRGILVSIFVFCPAISAQWKLLYEEDFTTPLSMDNAGWVVDTYEQPFDTIVDDSGDWYKNDYGPAFAEALNSFYTYRKEFTLGQDGWLTASLSARDSNKDGILDSEPTLTIESFGSGNRQKNALTMTILNHTGGIILRPTNPLPDAYRIEYKLTNMDFGGRRNGSIVHPDGKINGYSPEGCKTQHPWGEGSRTAGWSGNASAPYCDWQGVRTGAYAYNGFHFLAIVDFADPAPRNNHFWHYHRKVLMDSFSQHPDRFGDGNGGLICNADTLQYYNYNDSDSYVTLNMWISGLPGTWSPNPGSLVGNSQHFITDCNGRKATEGVQSAGELLTSEFLSPNEYYTFAIERNASGYILEASGRFARVGFQKYRFFRPFIDDDQPIWHYNVDSSEYDGRYNSELLQANWAFGSQSWPDQWPMGSSYPDYFVIGDLYTNVYEGHASVTDVRLFVPDTDVTECDPIVLLETGGRIDSGASIVQEGYYLYQRNNGALELWTGSPESPGSLYWETGVNESVDGATYYSMLQGDGNLVTWRSNVDGTETLVWNAYSTQGGDGAYYFIRECEGQRGGVAIYNGFPNQGGASIWSEDGFFWLPQSTSVPQSSPVSTSLQPTPLSTTTSDKCMEPETLMQQGDKIFAEQVIMSDKNNFHLYQSNNGTLELWEGSSPRSGELLWESLNPLTTTGIYYTTLQGDGNLVTKLITQDDAEVVWASGTTNSTTGNYRLVLRRCRMLVVLGTINEDSGEIIWRQDLLLQPTSAPTTFGSLPGGASSLGSSSSLSGTCRDICSVILSILLPIVVHILP